MGALAAIAFLGVVGFCLYTEYDDIPVIWRGEPMEDDVEISLEVLE